MAFSSQFITDATLLRSPRGTSLRTLTCAVVLSLGLVSFTAGAAPDETDDAALNSNASQTTSQRLIEVKGQIQSINEELSGQRANLGKLQAEIVAQREENDEFRRNLLNELKALRRQNQSLLDSIYDDRLLVNKDDMSEIKPLRNYDLQTPDGKMYFGEDEYFYVKEADATFDARVDTGAAVSSISAKDITEFERNGKRWYRFTIEANDHNIEVEAPFVRTSTIRQSSKETTTERVVVSLNIKIGNYSTKSEFTLTDRTRMQYPLLIGRTLIQDIAVVDVARDHIQGRNPDTFLILNRDDYQSAMKKGKDPNAEFKAKQALAVGQIARPAASYGANLGTNSENALPVVRNKKEADAIQNGQKSTQPATKATPAKAPKDSEAAADNKSSKSDQAVKTEKSAQAEKSAAKIEKAAKDEQAATKNGKSDQASPANQAAAKDAKAAKTETAASKD